MTRLHTILGLLAIGGAGLYAACSKTTPEPEKTSESPTPSPSPSPSPSAAKHDLPSSPTPSPAAAGPEDIAWEAPKAWESVPNANTMRKATYKIPKVAGDTEDAELTVSAAGGGVEANIQRWSGQFGNAEAKTEPRSPNGLKVTVVEIKGTFASGGMGMMGGPTTSKDKYMLIGAVVDGGDRQHFFKMTGPEKTVTAAKKDFDAFVASFRAK
ncbi:MAG: hypothetical protein KF795_12350 [Labilithrix sp.]|nr:hypothetical protein [Labilithrix sp.]